MLFDEKRKVVDITSAPDEIVEVIHRIDKQQRKIDFTLRNARRFGTHLIGNMLQLTPFAKNTR